MILLASFMASCNHCLARTKSCSGHTWTWSGFRSAKNFLSPIFWPVQICRDVVFWSTSRDCRTWQIYWARPHHIVFVCHIFVALELSQCHYMVYVREYNVAVACYVILLTTVMASCDHCMGTTKSRSGLAVTWHGFCLPGATILFTMYLLRAVLLWYCCYIAIT